MKKLVLLFAAAIFSAHAYADCRLTNMKVHPNQTFKYRLQDGSIESVEHVVIANLEQEIYLKKSDMSQEQILFFQKHLEGQTSLELSLKHYSCKELRRSSLIPASYVENLKSSRSGYDCIECLSFKSAPLIYSIPSFKEFEKILSDTRLPERESKKLVHELVPILEALPRNKSQANSILFSILVLKKLADYGVEYVSGDDLLRMADQLKGKVEAADISTFKKAVGQIDYVEIKKGESGKAELKYFGKNGKDMIMVADDIYGTVEEKKEVKKHFEMFQMKHGATVTITEKGKRGVLPIIDAKIEGLEGKGAFPIIGSTRVQIKKINTNSDEAAAVVGVKASKGIFGINHDIKVDY